MFKNKIKIPNLKGNYISNNINKVFIIAEAGISHFGSLAKAKKLVDLAKNSGADAIKFQAYLTEELVSKKYKNWFVRYKKKKLTLNSLDILVNIVKKIKYNYY